MSNICCDICDPIETMGTIQVHESKVPPSSFSKVAFIIHHIHIFQCFDMLVYLYII